MSKSTLTNTTFNQVISTSLMDVAPYLTENIITNQVILWKLDEMGGIVTMPGGSSWVFPIIQETNSTVRSFSGWDPLDVTVTDEITAAEYLPRQVAGTMSLSGIEKYKNGGDTRVVDLWGAKATTLAVSMRKAVNTMLYSDGTGGDSKDIVGLLAAVENGDAWSTYGRIDSNANTFWRNTFVDAADYHTATNLTNGLRTLVNGCTGGGDFPTLLIGTQTIHEAYEAVLDTLAVYNKFPGESNEGMIGAGWYALNYKGIPFVWDTDMLPNTTGDDAQGVVALNLNYLKFAMAEGYAFEFDEPQKPINQDGMVAKCLLYANLIVTNRRRQGRMDIATS